MFSPFFVFWRFLSPEFDSKKYLWSLFTLCVYIRLTQSLKSNKDWWKTFQFTKFPVSEFLFQVNKSCVVKILDETQEFTVERQDVVLFRGFLLCFDTMCQAGR